MGKRFSKHSSTKNKTDTNVKSSGQNVPRQEQYEIYDPDKYDLEAVEALKREFKDDPEMFVLNMLLMSFMFFDDYQKEIRFLANTSSERGKSVNTQLIQDHQKQILMPDSVLDSVNKRVKFRLTRGPKKGLMEPLTSQRMFILHHTIEIEDETDVVDYDRIDKPSYRAEIEESKDHRGFVKVLLGNSRKRSNESDNRPPSTDSACSTSSTKIYRKKSEIVIPNKNSHHEHFSTGVHGNDSGFSTGGNSESSYEYSRITAARTPGKLYISEKDVYTNISQLPSKCITAVKVKNEENWSDSDSDDDDSQRHKKHKRGNDLFVTHDYLNSTEFKSHFKNNVFPNYLGEVLGFTEESIQRTISIPDGEIYCDTEDVSRSITQWEVIPAIPLPWPDKIAYEWTLRRRRTVWDRREKKPIAYKWPNQKMVDEANKLDCVVTPRGFMPKKGKNPNMHIEWEVGFPKAERYLEFRMSYAQMRMFLYLITLHKNFIEPLTKQHGLIIDHIRILMLWECEANYKAWPEDKLGTKLKLVLEKLYEYMGAAKLPHYFINSRNVFENIPRMYLIPAQDMIHKILETPLPYVLSALRHLKYMPGKFYPEPDLDELYRIITSPNVLHREAQLDALALEKAKQQEEAKRKKANDPKNNARDKKREWDRRYLEQQRHAHKREMVTNSGHRSKNLKTDQRKESTESINLNFSSKILIDDIPRQILLLTFFVEHFLQIAKRTLKISTTNQTLFYLKQAWYLTMLLKDFDPKNALKFQKRIKEQEDVCLKKQVTEPKIPSTPKRNSTMLGSEILQVKGRDINIANLNKSYNANAMVNEPIPSSSGVKKKAKAKQHLMEATPSPKANRSETEYAKDINTANLSKSYNTNAMANQQMPSTSRATKKTEAKQNLMEATSSPKTNRNGTENGKDINNANVTEQTLSTSEIMKNQEPKQIQMEVTSSPKANRSGTDYKNNRNSLYEEDEDVEIRKHSPANRIIKSVSFRTQGPSIEISVTDDEDESTTL